MVISQQEEEEEETERRRATGPGQTRRLQERGTSEEEAGGRGEVCGDVFGSHQQVEEERTRKK